MSSGEITAELSQLDTLARRLGTCSGEVDELKRSLTMLIGTTTWTGGAADRFRQEWETQFRPALDRLATELVNTSQEVDRRKIAIDQAGN